MASNPHIAPQVRTWAMVGSSIAARVGSRAKASPCNGVGVGSRADASPGIGARSALRAMSGVVAVACLIGACGGTKLSLLPPISTENPRDPNPTRPLVENPANQPPREEYSSRAATAQIGPLAAGTTAAAGLVWLFAGKRPLIGLFGTFDENALFETRPTPKQPAPAPEP